MNLAVDGLLEVQAVERVRDGRADPCHLHSGHRRARELALEALAFDLLEHETSDASLLFKAMPRCLTIPATAFELASGW